MDKKPLLLRTILVIVVAATFAAAMYPLSQRDYYEVFSLQFNGSLLNNAFPTPANASPAVT